MSKRKVLSFGVLALLSLFIFPAFGQGGELVVDPAEVEIIQKEIIEPMNTGEIDAALAHVKFPFKVGEKKYDRAGLKTNFTKVFTPEILNDLRNSSNYEAMNFEGDAYMVSGEGPEGYQGAVTTFEKVNGKWLLSGMDLYEE